MCSCRCCYALSLQVCMSPSSGSITVFAARHSRYVCIIDSRKQCKRSTIHDSENRVSQ
ncbi:hypothetical protein PR001_g343 [Phytophthora rubi]|uniref:Uncharacterized protein n=1 Tax=Phytophthora rubi TaxID=129364 RepID=A0A6A3P3B9_9STRA|nr:hypothetical protein PR001_g343 [Phytophthora rubi]